MNQHPENRIDDKDTLRHRAMHLRKELPDRANRSTSIIDRLVSCEEYRNAEHVLVYISVRTEVQTWPLIERRLQSAQSVYIPYCVGGDLNVFHLTDADELGRASFGILEPLPHLREAQLSDNHIDRLELAVIPGVAFDFRCNRVGYGKGHFDRFLSRADSHLMKIAFAFECQMFEQVPADEHDVSMDKIITEARSIER